MEESDFANPLKSEFDIQLRKTFSFIHSFSKSQFITFLLSLLMSKEAEWRRWAYLVYATELITESVPHFLTNSLPHQSSYVCHQYLMNPLARLLVGWSVKWQALPMLQSEHLFIQVYIAAGMKWIFIFTLFGGVFSVIHLKKRKREIRRGIL